MPFQPEATTQARIEAGHRQHGQEDPRQCGG